MDRWHSPERMHQDAMYCHHRMLHCRLFASLYRNKLDSKSKLPDREIAIRRRMDICNPQ